MQISVEDGIVVCSLEDENKRFTRMAAGCFEGFYNGKLKIRLYTRLDDGDLWKTKEEIRIMDRIAYYASICGVDVDPLFFERKAVLKAVVEADRLKRIEEQQGKAARERWVALCAKGCGNCKYLKNCGDDSYCLASGDLLEEKNMPGVISGVHYMFNYEAFPSVNCLYKND